MTIAALIALFAIGIALAFDFVNGFHDTANAVATVIYSKALKPQTAIIMSGVLNFLGAVLVGTAVAKVITKIIPQDKVTLTIVVAVLIAGLIWNVLTWWFGLPVSSSHCLIASLVGAGIAAYGVHGIDWSELNKVSLALLISPIAGFIGGALLTKLALKLCSDAQLEKRQGWMRLAQVLSSASVSFGHGGNDGQKTMGIITLLLAMQFPAAGYTMSHVPLWVIIAAAAAMGLGTTIGGWRVIKTVGTKITREHITYAHGFGAELSTAAIIYAASLFGAPISTTHTLTSAVAGSALPKAGARNINWRMMNTIAAAWILTIPAAALLAAGTYHAITCLAPAELAQSARIHTACAR